MRKYLITRAVTLAAVLMSVPSEAAIEVDVYKSLVFTKGDALDIFDKLQVVEKLEPLYDCYDNGGGGHTGNGQSCIPNGSFLRVKAVDEFGHCSVENGNEVDARCSFRIGFEMDHLANSKEILLPDQNELGRVLAGQSLRSAGNIFVLRCDEIVQNRLYDCFAKINFKSPRVSVNLSSNSRHGELRFVGGKLLGSYFRTHAKFYNTHYPNVETLLDALKNVYTDLTSEAPPTPMYGYAFTDAEWSSVEIDGLEGKVISATQSEVRVELLPSLVKGLRESIKPGYESTLDSGVTIFGRNDDGRMIEFSPDKKKATLTIFLDE